MSNRLDQLESKVTHLTSQISETFSKIYLFHLLHQFILVVKYFSNFCITKIISASFSMPGL